MAITVKRAAVGDAADTGTPRTPSPKFVAGPVLREKDPGGELGQNHYVGPSSAPVDAQPQSPMAKSLAAAQDDGDSVLSAIQKGGVRALGNDWQTRPVDPNANVPVHPAMQKRAANSGSPGSTIPSKIGAPTAVPMARKPGA